MRSVLDSLGSQQEIDWAPLCRIPYMRMAPDQSGPRASEELRPNKISDLINDLKRSNIRTLDQVKILEMDLIFMTLKGRIKKKFELQGLDC